LTENSLASEIYGGAKTISERHRHRFEFNPDFREKLEKGGLRFTGISLNKKFVEIVELPREVHPFFIGCQFHPEYKSKPLNAHPLFDSFVQAAWQNRVASENLNEDISGDKPILAESSETPKAATVGTEE
jgi:CTP synthase